MAINRVDYGEDTLIDISDSTVTPDKLLRGTVAYDKNGNRIVGTFVPLDTSDATITANDLKTGVVAYNSAGERVVGSNDTLLYMDIKYLKDGNNNTDARFANCVYNLEGFDLPKTVTGIYNFLQGGRNIKSIPSSIDFSRINSANWAFGGCLLLTEIPNIDSENFSNIDGIFSSCSSLKTIARLDFSKVGRLQSAFAGCSSLKDLGGFINLGKGFYIKTENSKEDEVNLENSTSLTKVSLLNVIRDLYDLDLNNSIKNTTTNTLYRKSLKLGSTNLAKLTADEIAIATNKGWNVT